MRGEEREEFTWRDIQCSVIHRANHRGSEGWSFIKVRVEAPADHPLPIADSGIGTRELDVDEITAAGGIVPYVIAWFEREATTVRYAKAIARWRQTDLFDR